MSKESDYILKKLGEDLDRHTKQDDDHFKALHSELEKQTDTLDEIKESQIRMEEDVKHHIKRTDTLENMIKPVYRAYSGMKWAGATIVALGAIAAAVAKIQGLF